MIQDKKRIVVLAIKGEAEILNRLSEGLTHYLAILKILEGDAGVGHTHTPGRKMVQTEGIVSAKPYRVWEQQCALLSAMGGQSW